MQYYTTQNLLRITFTVSCQHFPPKHIFKFLVNQCWKLIQRCCLKVSLSSLSRLFQHMHRSMSTLKFGHSRKRVNGTSMCMSILPLHLRISFHIIVSFSVNLCFWGLQSSFGEISENCDFDQKCVLFIYFYLFYFFWGGGGGWVFCFFFPPKIRKFVFRRLKLFFIHSATEC